MWRTIVLVAVSMLAFDVAAHSGRTNAQGCHNDRKNGGYHCHNGGTPRSSASGVSSYRPSPISPATIQPNSSMPWRGLSTTVAENFYVCVQDAQDLAQNYSATLLSNTHEQYKVQLDMEDGSHTITCLTTHQKIVEHNK